MPATILALIATATVAELLFNANDIEQCMFAARAAGNAELAAQHDACLDAIWSRIHALDAVTLAA